MPHTMNPTDLSVAEQNTSWAPLPALQQPDWRNHPEYPRVRRVLSSAPPLVTESEVAAAHRALAEVAAGRARTLQVGDCAESFADAGLDHTSAKIAVLDTLADHLETQVSQEVMRFGRIAGQYAKPRSSPVEIVDGIAIPVYRGDLVNSAEATAELRQHDPRRMLQAYRASRDVLDVLRAGRNGPWCSHEALVLDYESPLIRANPDTGDRYLGSTHFPWVGERTRQLDHAHIGMLASVSNPVGCKIGPTADPETVVRLCELLDPNRTPGRLTLIIRMGLTAISDTLPAIALAVRRAGHPVVWLSDPMHGNTVHTTTGQKTRHLIDVVAEARRFRRILEEHRLHPGGLHLEVASTDVTECVGGPVPDEEALFTRYESLCDPRLNLVQALELIDTVF